MDDGYDVIKQYASGLFNVRPEDVTPEQRAQAKTLYYRKLFTAETLLIHKGNMLDKAKPGSDYIGSITGRISSNDISIQKVKHLEVDHGSAKAYAVNDAVFSLMNFSQLEKAVAMTFSPAKPKKLEGYRMYIDDRLFPPSNGWIHVKTYKEAIAYMVLKGCPLHIDFDHDLGPGKTGDDIARWIIEQDLNTDKKFIPHLFTFECHSGNPIGKENILCRLEGYMKANPR